MNIYEKLNPIQSKLTLPDNQGSRSVDDILAAVKPLLTENSCVLILSDIVEHVGDTNYIKSIASLIDVKTDDRASATGIFREEVIGAYQSARKIALSGLLLLDNRADTPEQNKPVSVRSEFEQLMIDNNVNIEKLAQKYNVRDISELTAQQRADIKHRLEIQKGKQ